MKATRIAAFALTGVFALGSAYAFGGLGLADDEDEPFEIGSEIPEDIVLTDIRGNEHTFGDYRDKVLVLNFWSIQCPWSIGYDERFKEFAADYAEEDVVLLAIDSNHTEVDDDADDPLERIKKFVKKAEIDYPVLVDSGNVVADRFAAQTTPHVFVIDGEGILSYIGAPDDDPKGENEMDDRENYLRDAVDALLAGEEVEVTETRAKGCSIKRVRR